MSNTASTRMAGAPTSAALQQFRDGFCGCLDGWGDALFELADAALCARSPVTSVPTLSLESVFRRSHSSLYKGLARGEIDTAALRCAPPNRPTAGPGSSWPPTPNSASPAASVLTVVDLADDGVIGVADVLGVRRPRPLVAGGALVGCGDGVVGVVTSAGLVSRRRFRRSRCGRLSRRRWRCRGRTRR